MASTRSKRSQNPYRTLKELVKAVVLGLSRQSVSSTVIMCHQVSSAVISCHPVPSLVVIACHPVSSAAIIQCHSVSSAVIHCHLVSSAVILSCSPGARPHQTTRSGSPKPHGVGHQTTRSGSPKPLRMVAKTTRVGQGTQSGSVQRGRLAEVAVAGGPADWATSSVPLVPETKKSQHTVPERAICWQDDGRFWQRMTADDSKWRELANPGKAPEQG